MRTGTLVVALTIVIGAGAARAADTATLALNHPAQVDTMPTAGIANPGRKLSMEIRLGLRNPQQLNRLIVAQHDPASREYKRWLSVAEFNRRFGARQADADAIAAWLRDFGFAIKSANADDGFIAFTGTVAQAQRAFSVNLARFGGGTFANTNDPIIPARFAASIGAISGLDNMTLAVPTVSVRRVSPGFESNGEQGFGPADLYTFYDESALLNRASGSGQCIAIVGVSDISDGTVSGFNSQFGLPATTLTRKNPEGVGESFDGNEVEAELDVQWSHAAAPGAPIFLYLSNSLPDAITAAVNDNQCSVISISFGFCGAPASFYTRTLGIPFRKAAATGQTIFVASGDQGAAGLVFDRFTHSCVVAVGSRHPSEIAGSPNVIAVGGTLFTPIYDGNGNDVDNVQEQVWNDGEGASGGGISTIFGKPSYQAGVHTGGRRGIPDVALIASPSSPGAFMDNAVPGFQGLGTGITCCIGGTSLATPVWAGFARVISQFYGQRLGNLNFEIYPLAKSDGAANGFRDVTQGDNGFNGVRGFPATSGYDLATGWGTIDVYTFANAFAALPIGRLKLSPRALHLGRVAPGRTSAKPRFAALINRNHLQPQISAITITPPGAFVIDKGTTTCPIGLGPMPENKCVVGVKFSPPPSSSGPMSATLSISDNGSNSPQTVTLKGIAR